MERTFIAIKPDGVVRGLTGEIISRFERVGLKVVAAKLMQVSDEHAEKHYPTDRHELWKGVGQKTLDNYAEQGIDAVEVMGTADPKEIGDQIREGLHKYITEGPVFACVLEAHHAVELVRQIVGHTMPLTAAPGTIRGDYSYDSPAIANVKRRPVRNLVHASGNVEEAEHEIALWFKPEELVTYKRSDEAVMMGE